MKDTRTPAAEAKFAGKSNIPRNHTKSWLAASADAGFQVTFDAPFAVKMARDSPLFIHAVANAVIFVLPTKTCCIPFEDVGSVPPLYLYT